MTFAHPWVFHLLWLLPLTGLALVVYGRRRRRAMEGFADPELLLRLTDRDSRGRRILKGLLLLAALGLMILSLAGPRWGSHYQEVSQKGVDIMILVDVSPSMLVEDISPNRLERARREIQDFLRVVQGDRVGLVAFSGAAFVQCPLTLDYAALQMFLNAVQPDLVPVPGTDLGAAIEVGLSAFDLTSATDRVMLLITDGEDNENQGLKMAPKAAEKGVKIFVFGMGEPAGGPIPASDGKGGFRKDESGNLILSKLDEQGLERIATATGGTYARSVAGDLDLDILYFDGIKSRTQAAELKSGKIKVYEERFTFFALAAFLLLLLEGFITESPARWRQKEMRPGAAGILKTTLFLLPLVWLFLGPVWGTAAFGSEDPDALYQQGRFSEAEEAYSRADMDNPKDIRYRYNRGCAAYQNNDYSGAAAAFSSVLRRAEDPDIQFKAHYNLGNSAFNQGDFATAAEHYRQALQTDPESEDARYNLELALRELEKHQKEKDAEQKGQPREDSQDSGDKGDSSKPSDQGKDAKEPSQEESTKQEASQGQGQQKEQGQDQPGEERPNPEQAGGRPEQGPEPQPDSAKDLSGDLAPLQALPEDQAQDTGTAPDMSKIDKNKAEALLDNIQEDRSQFLRFQVPQDKRYGVPSGKDW